MKKLSRSALIKKLDRLFSTYIRKKYSQEGICTCISCGIKQHRKQMHNAHWISRGCYRYRRDEMNCRPACVSCNSYRPEYHIREYTIRQIDRLGKDKVDEMRKNEKRIYKIGTPELRDMVDQVNILLKKYDHIK